jgi:transcriptional regulator with XRE-family HTH domain
MDRPELADFLRRRRAALQPADVGLPDGVRRRAAGLRREEVAQLTGMSADYYTRIEQGRGPQPSEHMIAALARTLRLSHDERDYLFRVAGHPAPDRRDGPPHVAPALMRVLDRLDDTPAMILSSLTETLAANRLAVALFGDHTQRSGLARYDVYRWFTEPGARDVYPVDDQLRQSRAAVANLRAVHGVMGPRSRAGALVRALQASSAEFTDLWREHAVSRRFQDHKTLVHRELGPIELDCQCLFSEDQSQLLLVLTAAARSEARGKIQLLGAVGTQRFTP